MSFIPLSRLLTDGRAPDHAITLGHGQALVFGQLQNDVTRLIPHWQGRRRAVLACGDGYTFAAALLSLLHAGVDIVFPANLLPATIEACASDNALIIDDALINAAVNTAVTASDARLKPFDPRQSKLFFYTSGSTGAPKIIEKTPALFEIEALALQNLWGQQLEQAPVFSTAAHLHVYGLTFKIMWPLMRGAAFVSHTYALWENLLTDLTNDAVIISSPAHLERLSGLSSNGQTPRAIFSAGAPLSLLASAHAETIFGTRVTEIFGSTEVGACATRMQYQGNEAWRLLPGVAMRVERDGCLSLQSPFAGPDWLKTSDLVTALGDGFAFQGRADRIVKIEGKRVSLSEVETALEQLSEVKNAAIVALEGASQLGAIVVPTSEGQTLLRDMGAFRFGRHLRARLGQKLEAAALPRRWRFHDEVPTQMLGKRRDADLRALFAEKDAS